MKAEQSFPPAPKHLSAEMAQWWDEIVRDVELEPHNLRQLNICCSAWDRAELARIRIAAEGMTVTGSNGAMRPHPLLSVERDARLLFLRALREVDIRTEVPANLHSAPPRLVSNRG